MECRQLLLAQRRRDVVVVAQLEAHAQLDGGTVQRDPLLDHAGARGVAQGPLERIGLGVDRRAVVVVAVAVDPALVPEGVSAEARVPRVRLVRRGGVVEPVRAGLEPGLDALVADGRVDEVRPRIRSRRREVDDQPAAIEVDADPDDAVVEVADRVGTGGGCESAHEGGGEDESGDPARHSAPPLEAAEPMTRL